MKLTDTHCHLYLDQFSKDLEDVIQRAVDSSVEKIVVPGIDMASSRAAVELAGRYENIFAAVGVHPNSAAEWNGATVKEITAMADGEKVVAIGEIGLDYHWNISPKEMQERVFQEQLELAAKLDKPIIVHNRDATTDVLKMLKSWIESMVIEELALAHRPGVLHSFSGDERQAETALDLGLMIGIAGPVTFKNAAELQGIVSRLPQDRLLIETDAPYLSPHPHRGKRNEPSMVSLVNGKISELKNASTKSVAEATYANAERLFRW